MDFSVLALFSLLGTEQGKLQCNFPAKSCDLGYPSHSSGPTTEDVFPVVFLFLPYCHYRFHNFSYLWKYCSGPGLWFNQNGIFSGAICMDYWFSEWHLLCLTLGIPLSVPSSEEAHCKAGIHSRCPDISARGALSVLLAIWGWEPPGLYYCHCSPGLWPCERQCKESKKNIES